MNTTTKSSPVISAKRVTGTPVYNISGDRLGEIDDLMIEKRSGEVVYAIMSFGGFLGIGEKYHPLPWQVLQYDTASNGYVQLDKESLKKAPYFSRDEISDSDLAWRERVFGYYSTPRTGPDPRRAGSGAIVAPLFLSICYSQR